MIEWVLVCTTTTYNVRKTKKRIIKNTTKTRKNSLYGKKDKICKQSASVNVWTKKKRGK